MLITYNPITLAFIIDLPTPIIRRISSAVIEALVKLESTDYGYIYTPNSHITPYKHSAPLACFSGRAAVACVATLRRIENFRLDTAMKHTLSLLQTTQNDMCNHVFIMLERYSPEADEYHAQKGFDMDLRNGGNTHFILCDVGTNPKVKQLCSYHPHCDYLLLNGDTANMSKQLIEMYYPAEERSEIDEEFKQKYGLTPQEAREALKEKYANTTANPPDAEN